MVMLDILRGMSPYPLGTTRVLAEISKRYKKHNIAKYNLHAVHLFIDNNNFNLKTKSLKEFTTKHKASHPVRHWKLICVKRIGSSKVFPFSSMVFNSVNSNCHKALILKNPIKTHISMV